MYSIRKLSATLALGLLVAGVGCQKKDLNPQPAMNNQLIPVDDAMAKRSWQQSNAVYQNTSVPAGPDRMLYEPKNPDYGWWLDTPLFVANSAVLPFTYIKTGADTEVANPTGASIGPGYTAIPAGMHETAAGEMNYGAQTQKPQQTTASGQKSAGGSK